MYSIVEDKKMLLMSVTLSLVIILGLLGNVINLIVFFNKSMKNQSTFRYLIYLSLLDSLILTINATDSVLTISDLVMIRLISNLFCKLHTFISTSLIHLKSLVLVVVSIDLIRKRPTQNLNNQTLRLSGRKFSKNDLTKKSINKRKRFNSVDLIVLSVSILVALMNLHYLILLELNNFKNTKNQSKNPLNFKLKNQNFRLKFFDYLRNIYNTINSSQDLSHKIMLIFKGNNSDLKTIDIMCHPALKSNYRFFLINISIWIDIFITQILPILVTFVCLIIFFRQNKTIKSQRFSSQLQSDRNYLKLLLTLIIINLYLIFSSIPLGINTVLFSFKDIKNENHLFQVFFQTLAYTSCGFNCILFLAFLSRYRKVLSIFFMGEKHHEKTRSNLQSRTSLMVNNGRKNRELSSTNPTSKKMVRFSMNEQETAEHKLMDALFEITRI